jgi:hypothetical protein
MLPTFTVVYDACILYPAAMRSLLMYLAISNLYRARWTDQIHDEWIRNVLKDRPDISASQLTETRRLMDYHAKEALVTGYQGLIPSLVLPDVKDCHVLAAAIRCNADVVVTYNIKDFPANVLEPYGIEAQHPDVFLSHLINLEPGIVLAAIHRQIRQLRNPPVSPEEFMDKLEVLQLPQTAAQLRGLATLEL